MRSMKTALLRRLVFRGVVLVTGGLVSACTFHPKRGTSCTLISSAKVASLTSSEVNVAFEDPGTLIVYQGADCAQSNRPGTENVLNSPVGRLVYKLGSVLRDDDGFPDFLSQHKVTILGLGATGGGNGTGATRPTDTSRPERR